jgi:TetR/AcrR family transcriptional repressor of nem operon
MSFSCAIASARVWRWQCMKCAANAPAIAPWQRKQEGGNMRVESDTRKKLIAEGLKSMIVNGYDGIGLNSILDAADVPKGSFYHFFKSKEDFAIAVLETYERHYVELRNLLLNDRSASPLQRLTNYLDEVERIHSAETPLGGCLYGVLGQTAAVRSPEFRQRIAKVFSSWETQLSGLLKEAQYIGEVDADINTSEAAAFLIDAYEGMLIRIKVDGDKSAFARFKRFTMRSITSGAPAPRGF